MKNLLYCLALLFISTQSVAQVTAVDFQVDYTGQAGEFDVNVIFAEGSLTGAALERRQANGQLTIVTPIGTEVEIIDTYQPTINSSGVAIDWQISTAIDYPTTSQRFTAITPTINPAADYPIGLEIGDVVGVFRVSISDYDPCTSSVRLWDNDADPDPTMLPGGPEFDNGFTLASPAFQQLYQGNVEPTTNPPVTVPVVAITGPDEICIGQTSQLSPSSGGTWTSSDPAVLTVNNTGLVTALANGFATFTFIDDIASCNATTDAIIVLSTPAVGVGTDEICINEVTDLFPTSAFGTWVALNPTIAELQSNGFSVTGVTPGIAGFVYTESSSGCLSDTIFVTVDLGPQTNLAGDDEICVNETSQFSPTTGGLWTSADPLIATVTNSGLVTGISQGTTTFNYIEILSGCSSLPTEPITVLATPTVEIAGSDSICVMGNTQMSPSTGGAWSSANPSIATVDNAGFVTGLSPGMTTLQYTDSSIGCTSAPSELVTVLASPDVAITGSDNICVGETTTVIPSSGGTWVSSDPAVVSVTNAGVATGVAVGSAKLMFTSNDTGCNSEETDLITVSQSIPVNYQGPQEICVGQNSQLLPADGGIWTSDNPTVATISIDGLITGTGEGSVSFTFTTDQNGCSAISETMLVSGQVNIEDLGYNNLCVEQWTQFFADVPGGEWSTDDSSIAVIDPNGVLTGINLGDVNIKYTLSDGCSDEVQVTMVKSDAGPGQVIQCLNTNTGTYLQADGVGSWSLIGGSGTATIANASDPSTFVSDFSNEGEFLFEWTTEDGCQDYVTVSVRENCACFFPNNLVEPPSTNTFCPYDLISLSFLNAPPPGGTYLWEVSDNDETFSNPDFSTSVPMLEFYGINGNWVETEIYIRGIYNLSSECSDTSNVIRLFIGEVADTKPISGKNWICEGDTLRLSTQGKSGCQYFWSGPNGQVYEGQSIAVPNADAQDSGQYSVYEKCGECLGDLSTKNIQFYERPTVPLLESYKLCIGDTTTIYDPILQWQIFVSNDESVAVVEYGMNGSKIIAVGTGTVTFYNADPGEPCASYPSDTLFVGNTNGATITITGPDEICVGGTTTLSPTTGGTWTSITPEVATVTNAGVVTGISPGNCTFYFEPSSGTCQGSSTDPIIVYDCDEPCHPLLPTTTIGGQAYIDENENGIFDIGETPLSNVMITAVETGDMVLTGLDGIYMLELPKGTYTIKASVELGNWEQTEFTLTNVGQGESCVDGVDFGFIQTVAPPSMVLSLASAINRCDQIVKFTLWFENTGSEPLSGSVRVVFDTLTEHSGFIDPNATVFDNVITWSYSDLPPFVNNRLFFWLEMPPVDDPFPQLDYYVQFLDEEGNVVASDELHSELMCAVDPNDKQMKPNRSGDENYLLPGEELEYTVRFQNNGNDTAFLVTIVDALDENIDARTVSVVGSSHPVKTAIQGQEVTFTFDDILLVDSLTNVEESQGYVSFRCKTLGNLEEGVEIKNSADIVFGQNPPIVTNQVLNTFVEDLCFGPLQGDETRVICAGDSYLGHAESGVYLDSLTSIYGCDSVNIVDLTVEAFTTNSFDVVLCDGDSVMVNGQSYFNEGVYADTSYSDFGCPLVAYDFAIGIHQTVELTIDTSICPGETYQGLAEAGSYTIEVAGETGCDSIYTINLSILDINDTDCITATKNYENQIAIFPNPSNGIFTITSNTTVEKISIISANGGSVNSPECIYSAGKVNVKTNTLPSGIYILAIHTAGEILYKKIVIN